MRNGHPRAKSCAQDHQHGSKNFNALRLMPPTLVYESQVMATCSAPQGGATWPHRFLGSSWSPSVFSGRLGGLSLRWEFHCQVCSQTPNRLPSRLHVWRPVELGLSVFWPWGCSGILGGVKRAGSFKFEGVCSNSCHPYHPTRVFGRVHPAVADTRSGASAESAESVDEFEIVRRTYGSVPKPSAQPL